MQHNLQDYLTVNKDGSILNARCKIIGVRIRTVGDHEMWPDITGTTLLFSKKTKYFSANALDSLNLTNVYDFQKTIHPTYG